MGVQLITPDDLAYALGRIKAKQDACRRARNYYEGNQDLSFATDSFRSAFGHLFRDLAYNRCQSVVDAFDDRLSVKGWTSDESEENETPIEVAANEVWQRNDMDDRQSDVHSEAFRTGSSYLIVWPDPTTSLARFYPNDNHLVTLVCDETDDAPVFAVKAWREERGPNRDRWRVTVYERDLVSRWITAGKRQGVPEKLAQLLPYDDDEQPETDNPYGVVPVFQFRSSKLRGCDDGGELRDVIPLQDALNKQVADMLIAGEYLGYPQRVIAGVEPMQNPVTGQMESPFQTGKDRMIVLADNLAKWGEFASAALDQFTNAQDNFDSKIARVSGVPVHWLNQTGEPPSGESLKTAESPFVAKVTKWQPRFGTKWIGAMQLALQIDAVGDPTGEAKKLKVNWKTAESRSEAEELQNAAMRKSVGVPDEEVWSKLGYSTDQIKQFTKAKADAQAAQLAQFTAQFDRGNAPVGGN